MTLHMLQTYKKNMTTSNLSLMFLCRNIVYLSFDYDNNEKTVQPVNQSSQSTMAIKKRMQTTDVCIRLSDNNLFKTEIKPIFLNRR